MKICVLAVCMGLMLLAAGEAFAGGKEVAEYQCKVNGGKLEDCMLGCKTKEICAREEEALSALTDAREVVFYSLTGNEESFLQDDAFPIGTNGVVEQKDLKGDFAKDVASEFLKVLTGENYFSGCFAPRHALTVKTKAHTYDYLLCFECGQMALYEDGVYFSRIEAQRDAQALNALMLKAGMALPAFYAEQAEGAE